MIDGYLKSFLLQENRLIYDQSIAETLHTEKAWTELHDLLSQLQTKMAEAANTIRCVCTKRVSIDSKLLIVLVTA